MTRKIRGDCPAVVELIPAADVFKEGKNWLQTHAATYSLVWLLAHADDGVIWGKMDNGQLLTSDTVAPDISPPLRLETLQSARLFAPHAELLLWRDGENAWYARLIRDVKSGEVPKWQDAIDEPYILWGTDTHPLANDFTLLTDGAQGLRHAVPIIVSGTYDEQSRPLRLWVRHYLQEDENGFTRIMVSRLFLLETEGAK